MRPVFFSLARTPTFTRSVRVFRTSSVEAVCAKTGAQTIVRKGSINKRNENPVRRIVLPSISVERRFGLPAFYARGVRLGHLEPIGATLQVGRQSWSSFNKVVRN